MSRLTTRGWLMVLAYDFMPGGIHIPAYCFRPFTLLVEASASAGFGAYGMGWSHRHLMGGHMDGMLAAALLRIKTVL